MLIVFNLSLILEQRDRKENTLFLILASFTNYTTSYFTSLSYNFVIFSFKYYVNSLNGKYFGKFNMNMKTLK